MTRYVLGHLLATGGMAEIFVARQEGEGGLSREVAVKRVVPHLSSDGDFAALFTREASVLARLSHPNLVEVYDFDRDADGHLFLAMELVRGMDLSDLLACVREKDAKLDAAIAIHIAEEILNALAYIHAEGLVHRDVTPHNVLLSEDGAVKLGDFGIVIKATATTTQTRAVRGKFAYMSPEQALGLRVDGRSDLFSCGVLLFEMLTGRRPFTGATLDVLGQIAHRDPLPLNELERHISGSLSRVVERLLEKSVRRRFASAGLALKALRSVPERRASVEARLTSLIETIRGEDGAAFPFAATPIGFGDDRTRTVLRPARRASHRRLVAALLGVLAVVAFFLFRTPTGTGKDENDPQSVRYLRDYPVRWSRESFASPVDVVGFAHTADQLAGRAVPGARLDAINAQSVDSAGFAIPTDDQPIWYTYSTPIAHGSFLSYFAIAIRPDGVFFLANENFSGMEIPMPGPIRCSFSEVWVRAGLPSAARARVILYSPRQALNAMWMLMWMDGMHTVPDDCP